MASQNAVCPAGLVVVLSRPALNEVYLLGVSYVVVATFLALEVILAIYTRPRTPSTGVGVAMFFIYLTYSLLPIRLQEAVGSGVLLSIAQLACVMYLHSEDTIWRQVSTETIRLTSVKMNVKGTHERSTKADAEWIVPMLRM
jgi:adenylate cyclase 5